jgi:dolichol kinase
MKKGPWKNDLSFALFPRERERERERERGQRGFIHTMAYHWSYYLLFSIYKNIVTFISGLFMNYF